MLVCPSSGGVQEIGRPGDRFPRSREGFGSGGELVGQELSRRLCLGALELEQGVGEIVDGVLFVAAAFVAPRKRRQFQMDQLVNDGEFHVVQRAAEGRPVVARVQDANCGSLFFLIPVNVAQGTRPQIRRVHGDDGNVPRL